MAVHIDTGNMRSPVQYQSKTLEHLGLVSGMYDELEIGKLIDQAIPQDLTQRTVSIGQAIKAMVLNGLGFTQKALYLTPLFFKDKPVDILIGEGIEASHLNESTLGRSLDSIYQYGVEKLYMLLSASTVDKLGLLNKFGHLDSTCFHTDGKHNSEEDSKENVIQITKGYSRDHRPDLNQVVLQLICEQEAGIPLLMKPLSGNSSDNTDFRETISAHVEEMKTDFNLQYIVADSALYVAETLQTMKKILWITRVPERLSLARDSIHALAPSLMSDLTQSKFTSICTQYGDINQRWVIKYSPQAYQRGLKTVNKNCLKQSKAEHKAFNKLCKQDFACEADALAALSVFQKTLKRTQIHPSDMEKTARYNSKGCPKKGQEPDYSIYHIRGSISSVIETRTRELERKSCFILATNQLDEAELSAQDVIDAYKNQQKVERGFRFLKDPLFMVSTLFLESPKRIMALTMVMTLCLQIYAALEYRIRQVLKTKQQTFPSQKGEAISNPTARWVFQYFRGIHLLMINEVNVFVLNLNEHHLILLELLGKPYQKL